MKILIIGIDSNIGMKLMKKIHVDHPDWEIIGTKKAGSVMECEYCQIYPVDLMREDEIIQTIGHIDVLDAVVYLAAAVHDDGNNHDLAKGLNHEAPALSARSLLRKNMNLKFIYASTIAVYGETPGCDPVEEDAPCHPETVYAKTKYEAEKDMLSLKGDNGFQPIIIRIGTVISKTDRGQLNRMIRHIERFRFFVVPFRHQVYKTFVHIDDLVHSVMLLISNSPAWNIYNIAGPVTDLNSILSAMRRLIRCFVVLAMPYRLLALLYPKLLQNVWISSRRLDSEFNIHFKTFEEGIVSEYVE